MPKVEDILYILDKFAPCSLKEDWDNVGLLVGSGSDEVKGVLVALDITRVVLNEALEAGVNLLVSHHPLIYSPLLNVSDTTKKGSLILDIIKSGTSVICMHTNADSAEGGVNDVLAKVLGLKSISLLQCSSGITGRMGIIQKPMPLNDFLGHVKKSLNCEGLRFSNGGREVFKVAVGGGACSDLIYDAYHQGCDTMVTADVKYHTMQIAAELKLNLVDAGHFETEDPVCECFIDVIKTSYPKLKIFKSKNHKDIMQYFSI